MAFDSRTFKTRASTAIIFVIVMLCGLLWRWSFIVLFTVIHFGCWYEFVRLLKKIRPLTYLYFLPLGLLYITFPIALLILSAFYNTHSDDRAYNNLVQYSPVVACGIIFSIWVNDT